MNSKIIKCLLFGSLIIFFGSCKKWLDVKPEDKFIEESVFSSPQGFRDALNGLYLNIGNNQLYGESVNMKLLDVSAQLFPGNNFYPSSQAVSPVSLSTYTYTDAGAIGVIDTAWSNMYLLVTRINKFLENCETYASVANPAELRLHKGEALGLRAYVYLDLLRMFTPNYVANSEVKLIPYVDKTGFDIQPYSTSSFVMDKILGDLTAAEGLLNNDPAIAQAVVSLGNVQSGRISRNYKMNYYAVKALKARAYLWKGDKTSALAAAKELIGFQSKFPWVTTSQFNNPSQSNKVFSPELIFAAENPLLNDTFNRLFSSANRDLDALIASQDFQNKVFENIGNDYRLVSNWAVEGGKSYRTFIKYRDVTPIALSFNRTVPMIKMSEMYLIAAETEPDATTALGYLNTFRNNRGLATLSSTTDINNDIMKEYRKEFFGEGQLFFYYKRRNASQILYANGQVQSIGTAAYTYPVPLSETQPR
ncbi:RagB/SusD family nutrient uptake outer membrane protein [Pedobacter frigoris]|uniref:RagB/SusD family nutrient uptake outer membrane protein n=1 Tax=Pedobacter frigoris TaxID=2571272 RepID=UPI00292DA96A|nr:RagB/SusD family nutrient uptake outer membrane protein [Pedobacter frigoris]